MTNEPKAIEEIISIIKNLDLRDDIKVPLIDTIKAYKASLLEEVGIAYKRGYLDGAIEAQKLLKTN